MRKIYIRVRASPYRYRTPYLYGDFLLAPYLYGHKNLIVDAYIRENLIVDT